MRDAFDVFISGGGIAGLTAAAALGRLGCRVCLADPAPPVPFATDGDSDLRTTAYLRPAVDLFTRIGLWPDLAGHATPLNVLQIVDSRGTPPVETMRRAFRADEIGDGPFGWNTPNWLTRKVLAVSVADIDGVTLHLGTGFRDIVVREREALVSLTDGTRLTARLVIAADGHRSPVRRATGIGVTAKRYGQKALAFAVTHDRPHDSVSTEIYNQGGAFTLVPMQDLDGQPASAIVWMADGAESERRHALAPENLAAEATERSLHDLGRLTMASPVRIWPIVTQIADRMTSRRVALIAEAAHVLPPIGAQGLNTSLHDVEALANLVAARGDDVGGADVLRSYARARSVDVRRRAQAIDLFNRVCQSGASPVQALRQAGLSVIHDITPLRRSVMRKGLGAYTT